MAATHWTRHDRLPADSRPAAALWSWLTEHGSLTARLRTRCGAAFRLRVLAESTGMLGREDSAPLGLGAGTRGLIREVTLNCGTATLIYARSVIPERTLAAGNNWLAHLGEKPLGDVLFGLPGIEREPIEVACLQAGHGLLQRVSSKIKPDIPQLWARRSLLQLRGGPLLICECFLPELLHER